MNSLFLGKVQEMAGPWESARLSQGLGLAPLWWPLGRGACADIRMGPWLLETNPEIPDVHARIYTWDDQGNHQHAWSLHICLIRDYYSLGASTSSGRVGFFRCRSREEFAMRVSRLVPELRFCVQLFLPKIK